MNHDFLVSLLPIFGVVLGAVMQQYFSRKADSRKHFSSLKAQAYVDFVRAVAKLAQVGKAGSMERGGLLSDTADGKTRICIYGSARVVGLLAKFEECGSTLATPEAQSIFIRMFEGMRVESLGERERVSDIQLGKVLFGSER